LDVIVDIKTTRCQNRCPKESVIKNLGMPNKTWISSSGYKYPSLNKQINAKKLKQYVLFIVDIQMP